jgi:hypothetical protein
MLKRIESNGARMIIVETTSRFARDLMVQEVMDFDLRAPSRPLADARLCRHTRSGHGGFREVMATGVKRVTARS